MVLAAWPGIWGEDAKIPPGGLRTVPRARADAPALPFNSPCRPATRFQLHHRALSGHRDGNLVPTLEDYRRAQGHEAGARSPTRGHGSCGDEAAPGAPRARLIVEPIRPLGSPGPVFSALSPCDRGSPRDGSFEVLTGPRHASLSSEELSRLPLPLVAFSRPKGKKDNNDRFASLWNCLPVPLAVE